MFPLQRTVHKSDLRTSVTSLIGTCLSTLILYWLGFVTVLSWLAISIGKAVQEAASSLGSKQKWRLFS